VNRNFEENMRLHGHLMPALLIGLGSAAVFAQATPPLSLDELKEAIEAAKAPAPPAPYRLRGPSKPVTRNAPLDPEVARTLDPNKILTFGALYTPFIRAAMLARKAADAGRPFGLTDIPSETLDSLTYVLALPWERAEVSGPDRLVDTIYVVLTPPGSTDRAKIIEPVWVKADTSVLRNIFGPAVPERGIVAAFSPGAIQAGMTWCSSTRDRSMRSEWRSVQRMSRHGGREIARAVAGAPNPANAVSRSRMRSLRGVVGRSTPPSDEQ
jgi:hypothetical protein